MINRMLSALSGWPVGKQLLLFVALSATTVGFAMGGLGHTLLLNVFPFAGVALCMWVLMPPVRQSYSWYLRRRSGVPCRLCGREAAMPSASAWKRALSGLGVLFLLGFGVLLVNGATLAYAARVAAVFVTAAMVGTLLAAIVGAWIDYMADRRDWRGKLAAQEREWLRQEHARRGAEKFWGMVGRNYPRFDA